jgi:hypothetical protein
LSESQGEFLDYLKNNLNDEEIEMFANSFYMYLKYNPDTDFVIDLDNVWKWIGYKNKGNCKTTLVDKFSENNHYIVQNFASVATEAKKENDIPASAVAEAGIQKNVLIAASSKQKNLGGKATVASFITIYA